MGLKCRVFYFLRNSIFLFFTFLFSFNAFSQVQDSLHDALKNHVYTLASDSLGGRETGTIGQKKSAEYIASVFNDIGLSPANKGSYYHNYQLTHLRKNYSKLKSGSNLLFWPWHFYFVSSYAHSDSLFTQLVFVGYGSITEVEKVNCKNKAIALLADTPQLAYQQIDSIKNAFGNRNFVVIIPNKNKDLDRVWSDDYYLSNLTLKESFDVNYSRRITEEWANPKPVDSLNIIYGFAEAFKNVFFLKNTDLLSAAKESRETHGASLSGIKSCEVEFHYDYKNEVETVTVENVVGYIPGSGNETVVVSAHYDHIGTELGEVNYGADDNASGSAVLMESALLLRKRIKNGESLERNVLFIAFSGEEMGLCGSKAYVANPIFKLDSTVININMDMVGRWDERHSNKRDFVYLLTAGEQKEAFYKLRKKIDSPKYFNVSNKAGTREKTIFKFGSDHYSFFEKGVPIAVFFTGLHDDYHTPADTPDKINYKNLTNVTLFVEEYIYSIAQNEVDYPLRKTNEK